MSPCSSMSQTIFPSVVAPRLMALNAKRAAKQNWVSTETEMWKLQKSVTMRV